MKRNDRRAFIRKSLLGLSAASLLPAASGSTFNRSATPETAPELPSRTLGRTGMKTPLISFGAVGTSDPNFVRAAYNAGINFFFSATYYGEGNNERIVGEGLKGLPRDTFFVCTAVPADGFDNRLGLFKTPLDTDTYIRKAEASLTRFGFDYVDVFMFPYAGKKDSLTHEPLMKALQKLKDKGKTRFLGIATHSDCEEALITAADTKFYDFVMTSYNFRMNNKEKMNEAIDYASKAGLGVVAMKTLAGASRDKSGTKPLNTDAALKWVLQNKNISSIVCAMSSVEQLQKNIRMLDDIRLTADELKDLNLALAGDEPGLYCQQCRKCVAQCRHNLEIPTIMRSYMYAYGYHNTLHARYTLDEAGPCYGECSRCDVCTVKCTAGFDIKERITDIYRLKSVPAEFLKA